MVKIVGNKVGALWLEAKQKGHENNVTVRIAKAAFSTKRFNGLKNGSTPLQLEWMNDLAYILQVDPRDLLLVEEVTEEVAE